MKESIIIEQEDVLFINNKIKAHSKFFYYISFILAFCIMLTVAYLSGGKYLNILYGWVALAMLPIILSIIYLFLAKRIILGKTVYALVLLNENKMQFSKFKSFWKKDEVIIASLTDIRINKNPLSKLLFNKFLI